MAIQTVDLTNCDREPIHSPGSIQSHGVLLVLDATTLDIIQVSENIVSLLGREPQSLLSQPLSSLLSLSQISTIQQCLDGDFENINPLKLSIKRRGKSLTLDGIVHRQEEIVLLELEPQRTQSKASFFDFYQQVKAPITKIQKASTLQEMCQRVVGEIRKITGFDRVMVYQFDEEENGCVIAEDTHLNSSYLNLRYPASDIPKQARQLYSLSWLRIIPDARYQPIQLIPEHNPLTGEPLDLSLSVLRSVSPIHLEYMQNMGVVASMSISLMKNQKLWGLIACHHSEPKYIPYDIRTVCEFIGQVMSLELTNKEASEDLDYKIQLKTLQTQFVEFLSKANYFLDGIAHLGTSLLDLVNATGVVVCSRDMLGNGEVNRYVRVGKTPSEADTAALLEWIKPYFQHNLFHTRSLSTIYPAAESLKAIASGVLALEISKVHRNYILWFRPEVIQTVDWAGNPSKPVEILENGQIKISPRKSFDLWQETVSGYSLSWKNCEIEAVIELRSLIVGIVLRQADELASMNMELQRSNEDLDSFAYIASHDLKEPLRGIHNYANFLIEDYADTLNEDGVAKLETLVRLTQRMEDLINSLLHFSRLGRAELVREPIDLHELVQQVITTLTIARPYEAIDIRIPRPLPTVECDRAQVSEVFINLISNAIKYNDKPEKWVEVGFIEPGDDAFRSKVPSHPLSLPLCHSPTFYVRDNGIGVPFKHQDKIFQIFRRLHGQGEYGGGNGAGLTITRKVIERHGGKIFLESTPGEGSTFYFTLAGEATT
ncbi:GAF domain-containing protein [Oscillatoria sp. FACHB-1407]|nr:GAF domain-containing protein [Oscillatoria sp. FACHB-1407]